MRLSLAAEDLVEAGRIIDHSEVIHMGAKARVAPDSFTFVATSPEESSLAFRILKLGSARQEWLSGGRWDAK
jgi:hypothetical protein